MHKQLLKSIIVIFIIIHFIILCESSRKIRYHKTSNIERKASPQFPFNFGGLSDGEGGDIFGFLAYYTPEDDNISRNGQIDEYYDDYEFSGDDILIEYDDPVPSTTPRPRYVPTRAPTRPKSANVRNILFYPSIILSQY